MFEREESPIGEHARRKAGWILDLPEPKIAFARGDEAGRSVKCHAALQSCQPGTTRSPGAQSCQLSEVRSLHAERRLHTLTRQRKIIEPLARDVAYGIG